MIFGGVCVCFTYGLPKHGLLLAEVALKENAVWQPAAKGGQRQGRCSAAPSGLFLESRLKALPEELRDSGLSGRLGERGGDQTMTQKNADVTFYCIIRP